MTESDKLEPHRLWRKELEDEKQGLESQLSALNQELNSLWYKISIVKEASRMLKGSNKEAFIKKVQEPLELELTKLESDIESFEIEKKERQSHLTALIDTLALRGIE